MTEKFSVIVRRGSVSELAATADLWERAHWAGGRELATEHRGALVIAGIAKRMTEDRAHLLIAEVDGKLAGMVLGSPARERSGDGPIIPHLLHVSWVAVDPAYWGRGIATQLIEALTDHARASGFNKLQLWTHQNNSRAQRVYERLGFVASGKRMTDSFGNPILHYDRDL